MAAGRAALEETGFVARLADCGVDEGIARSVWTKSIFYYFQPLKPDPNDRWVSTMAIDPEDLEGNMRESWESQSWREPKRKNSVLIPGDPRLIEYARWLQSQRSEHA
jgi:hypothetical protein